MANTTIRLRKSGVASNVPVSLELGELALNYADGKLYYKNASGDITYISSGATTNSFATINANSSLIIATSNTDVLSLIGANNITVTGDGINKTITIGAVYSDSLFSNNSNIGASANAVYSAYQEILIQRDVTNALSNTVFDVYAYANNAYNQANGATQLAQAAYNYANTITGGGGTTTYFNYLTVQKQLYTANASQTDFFVNYTAPYVTVVINGATVDSSEYSTGTANTIILNNPASAGDIVDITGFYQANSATISSVTVDEFARNTANGANGLAAGAFNKANNSLSLTGGTVTGNVSINGNLTVSGNIAYTGNVSTVQVTGNSGQFFGDSTTGFGALYAGIPTGFVQQPQTPIQVSSNYNGYAQLNQQNINSGNQASADFIVTADNGTANDTYADFGMASSTYNYPGFGLIKPNDAYLIAYGNTNTGGGNLIISTGKTNDIVFAVNGVEDSNEVMRINRSNNIVIISNNPSHSNTSGSLQVQGGVGVTGNVYSNKVYTDGFFYAANGQPWQLGSPDPIDQYARNKANNALANTSGIFDGNLTTTGNVNISTGTASYSGGTGALTVNGGVGVAGNVYADKIYVNGLFWAANGNVISTGAATSSNQFNIFKYIATSNQTIFGGPDSSLVSLNYTPGAIIVTLNGLTLKPGTDYTATSGSDISLTVPADLDDELNIYGFTSTTVNTANTLSVFSYSASVAQTSYGGADQNGNILNYIPGNLFTTFNGITLRNGVDYTAANGSYINLNFSPASNDEITIYTFGSFNVANTYTIQQADNKFTSVGKSLAINFFGS